MGPQTGCCSQQYWKRKSSVVTLEVCVAHLQSELSLDSYVTCIWGSGGRSGLEILIGRCSLTEIIEGCSSQWDQPGGSAMLEQESLVSALKNSNIWRGGWGRDWKIHGDSNKELRRKSRKWSVTKDKRKRCFRKEGVADSLGNAPWL